MSQKSSERFTDDFVGTVVKASDRPQLVAGIGQLQDQAAKQAAEAALAKGDLIEVRNILKKAGLA